MSHKPENYISDVKVPILIVCSEKDSVNPAEESRHLYNKANEPKSLLMLGDAEHYQCYEGESFKEIVNKQIQWFDKYLK